MRAETCGAELQREATRGEVKIESKVYAPTNIREKQVLNYYVCG